MASLNEEFISHKSPSAGFDFTSGKRIEQKLLDYNLEAERFGGAALFLFYVIISFLIEINKLKPNCEFLEVQKNKNKNSKKNGNFLMSNSMVIESQFLTGYAYEELSEVSPDHRFLAYTMYDKDNDYFKLSVRNLNSGSLCSKPQAERVSNLAWAKDGQALLYVLTDNNKRPYRWVAVRIYIDSVSIIFLYALLVALWV